MPLVKQTPSFFCVTLKDNLEAIKSNIQSLNRLYSCRYDYTVIAPADSIITLKAVLNSTNLRFIDENTLITYIRFKEIVAEEVNKLSLKTMATNVEEHRLSWYYQQVLKLGFIIENSKNHPLTLIDADTILLRRIDVSTKKARSMLFTTPFERHRPYWQTLTTIFGPKIPFKDWESTTTQLMCLREHETMELERYIVGYQPRTQTESTYEWISRTVSKGVLEAHGYIGGSLISEQDFIGFFLRFRYKLQYKPIKFLRYGVQNRFSQFQIILLRLIGFYHITYENWQMSDQASNMSWTTFARLVQDCYAKLSIHSQFMSVRS